MPSSSSFPPWLLSVLLLPILSNASPINRQVGISDNVFMTTQNGTDGLEQRVCSIDAVTYMDGETIPTSSPCEHCVCRPPGFACTITSCEYRAGCKAFRRSDQCCPEYQCECEKDGKIYQNGDKIMDNNNPCEVCYCQGGEIICAVIDCYWRNDCQPRYIDNRCCPMYDHCPPPAAQGPIRHRLPTLTSPVPINWMNLTQSTTIAPPPPAPITEAASTTLATTTTTSTTVPSTVSTTTTTEEPTSTSTTTVATTTTEGTTSTTTSPPASSSVATDINVVNDEQESLPVSEATVPVTEAVTSPAEVQSEDEGIVNSEIVSTEVPVSDDNLTVDVVQPTELPVVPTSAQPELQGSLANDDDISHDEQSTTIPLNDDLPVENLVLVEEAVVTPTEPLPFGASSTAPALTSQPDTSVTVPPESTLASSVVGSAIVGEPTQVVTYVVGTTQEPVFQEDTVIVNNDEVVTTGAPSNDIGLSDETFETTMGTVPPQGVAIEVHDPTAPPSAVTEAQQQYDVTEKAVVEQEEETEDNGNVFADEPSNTNGIGESTTMPALIAPIPVERDQGQQVELLEEISTEHTPLVLNDEVAADVAITTVVPPVSHPQNDVVNQDEELDSIVPEVRHDLFDDNTESGNVVDDVVLADTSGIVTTPPASLSAAVNNDDKVEDISYADGVSTGTTERDVLQDAPGAAEENPVVTMAPVSPGENLVVQEIYHDASALPTTQSSLVDDEPASAVTVQNDFLPPSMPHHEDDEVASELVFNDEVVVATEQPLLISQQNDASVTAGTANTERIVAVLNDETVTQASLNIVADESVTATQPSVNELNHDANDISTEEQSLVNDEPVVTEKILNNEIDSVAQEIIQEDVPVPTLSPQQQQVYNDAPVTTVRSPVYHSNIDEAAASVADDFPAVHDDVEHNLVSSSSGAVELATPQVSKDTVVAESNVVPVLREQIVEKTAGVANVEQISQYAIAPPVSVTEAPSSGNNLNNGIFDIILDDEETPNQPETLNQVREEGNGDVVVNIHGAGQAEINNLGVIRNNIFSAPVETTVAPQPVELREHVPEQVVNVDTVNDKPEATTQINNLAAQVTLDEAKSPESSFILNDPPLASLTQDQAVEASTQRQFRDDIEDMLRHHINGASHEETEVTTVVADVVPLDDEVQSVPPTTARAVVAAAVNDDNDADVIADDEPAVVTTVSPQVFYETYRNKVQLVAATLAEQNGIAPASEEESIRGNKFRLEPSIFGGMSLENERNDVEVTTSRDAPVVVINNVVPVAVLSEDSPLTAESNDILVSPVNNDAPAPMTNDDVSTIVPIYDAPQTTVSSVSLALHDIAESDAGGAFTVQPPAIVQQDTVVEVVTEKSLVSEDAPVTDSPSLVQNDEERELADEVLLATTPVSVQVANDDASAVFTAVEGSGSHHDNNEAVEPESVLQDATEATSGGLARLDLDDEPVVDQTTVSLLNDEPVTAASRNDEPVTAASRNDEPVTAASRNDEPVTAASINDEPVTASSYSFRLDLSSVEDLFADEGASGHGPVHQDAPADDAVVEVTSQSPKQPEIPASVTEREELVLNDKPAATTVPELEVVQDEQDLAADAAAPTTLASLLPRFRTELELDTEAPSLPSSSSTVSPPVVAADELQQDFVVVSTGAPSGFAEEIKENDEVVTQAPVVVVPVVASINNDDQTVVHQAEDIIPEDDDAAATPANIPILSLISTDNKIVPFSNDEPVTQSAIQGVSDLQHEEQEQDNLVAHDDVAVTQPPQQPASIVNDEPITQSPAFEHIVLNDEPAVVSADVSDAAVTSAYVAISSDDTATTGTVNDDLVVGVTQAAHKLSYDDIIDLDREEILHDEPVVSVTQAAPQTVNDELAVTQRNQEIVNDEAVVAATENVSQRENDEILVTQPSLEIVHDEAIAEEESFATHDEPIPAPTSPPSSDLLTVLHDEKTETPLLDSHDAVPTTVAPVVAVKDEPSVVSETVQDDSVVFSDEPLPTVQPFDRLRSDLELGDSLEQQQPTEPSALNDLDATTSIQNDDISITTHNPVFPDTPPPHANPVNISALNSSIFAATKVVKKAEIVLPETGLPKIQPFSPDLRRDEHHPHELRFDFPMSPEKDTSWLSRAVAQFRRLTGFGGSSSDTEKPSAVVYPRTSGRLSNRRFLHF